MQVSRERKEEEEGSRCTGDARRPGPGEETGGTRRKRGNTT